MPFDSQDDYEALEIARIINSCDQAMTKKTALHSRSIVILPEFYSLDESFSIEEVVRITQVRRYQIAVYYRYGLISTVSKPQEEGWRFDPSSISALQRINHLRMEYGLNSAAVNLVCSLIAEIDRLRDESGQPRAAT
ncbi:chaperone modulator CbpM [Pelagicoccus sp. SDUM812003]|uniref:chaperone modulator CbpM n=1 Tax=Pelagicoccus sp. SDUM812003 TaxID=3041267 RepID=UPI00280F87F2|nr:chaperone modulator CbpM [Pelagicoccus sp. SDUM812003]MDQ8204302.1 chaperone modulator CbpM [Pelagicoccus sp. SDUM812003]